LQYTDIPDYIEPEEIRPMGNYAVSITWPDGFSQVIYTSDWTVPLKKKALNRYIISISISIALIKKHGLD